MSHTANSKVKATVDNVSTRTEAALSLLEEACVVGMVDALAYVISVGETRRGREQLLPLH
jgi:hypothetical protein